MAIIAACRYDPHGTLIVPASWEVSQALVGGDMVAPTAARPESLSFEPGYTHVARIGFSDADPSLALRKAQVGLEKTLARLEFEPGFRLIDVQTDKGRIGVNRTFSVTHQIVYAIERR